MTAQIALWLLSTLGAVAFFGLGWVTSVLRRPLVPAAPLPLPQPERSSTQDSMIASLRADLEARTAAFHRLESERDGLQQALRQARSQESERTALEQALKQAEQRAADRDELAKLLDSERRQRGDGERWQEALEATKRRHEQEKRVWEERTRVEADKLHKRIAELGTAASLGEQLRLQLEQAKAQMEALRSQAEQWREAASTTSTAGAKLKQLEESLRAAQSQASLAQGFQGKLQQAQEALQAEKARTKKLEAFEKEVLSLREQHRELAPATEESKKLGAALHAAKLELLRATERAQSGQQEAERLRNELATLREQSNLASGAIEKERKLETDLQATRLDFARAKESEERSKQELERLRNELAALRDQSSMATGATEELAKLGSVLQSVKIDLVQAQKRVETLEQERAELGAIREESERLRSELSRAAELEEEMKALRQKVQATETRGIEAEDLREQNRELRDQVRELERLEEDAQKADSLDAQLREARLNLTLLQRRLDEMGEDSESRVELMQHLEQARARAAEADELQGRLKTLEARLFALGIAPPQDEVKKRPEGDWEATLEEGPRTLIQAGSATSVLADNAGLPIASAGSTEHQEHLAALSGLALEFVGRAMDMLPIRSIRFLQLTDENEVSVTCSIFDSGGDRYVLAGVGPTLPSQESLKDALRKAQGALDRAGSVT